MFSASTCHEISSYPHLPSLILQNNLFNHNNPLLVEITVDMLTVAKCEQTCTCRRCESSKRSFQRSYNGWFRCRLEGLEQSINHVGAAVCVLESTGCRWPGTTKEAAISWKHHCCMHEDCKRALWPWTVVLAQCLLDWWNLLSPAGMLPQKNKKKIAEVLNPDDCEQPPLCPWTSWLNS